MIVRLVQPVETERKMTEKNVMMGTEKMVMVVRHHVKMSSVEMDIEM